MKKTKRSDFISSEEVSRWVDLYNEAGKNGDPGNRWAIFQGYAQKRAIRRLKLCTELVNSYQHKNVLDLACGGGHYGLTVAGKNAKWFGIDISFKMLVNARKLFKTKEYDGHFINADVTDLPFSTDRFQVIFAVGILSYFPDEAISKIIKQLPDLLVTGGSLVLQTIRLDFITWLRSRLPNWFPRPIRLPGPLYPRRSHVILKQLENTPLKLLTIIEMKKLAVIPFQTIYLFEKND